MAKSFFENLGAGIFQPVGDFVGGAVTALQPGRVQQMQHERGQTRNTEMNSLLSVMRSDAADDIKQQAAVKLSGLLSPELKDKYSQAGQNAMSSGSAGGNEADAILKQVNALGTARGKFENEDGVIDPSVAPFLDNLVRDISRRGQEYIFAKQPGTEAAAKRTPISQQAGTPQGGMTDMITTDKARPVDNRSMFSGKDTAFDDVDALTGAARKAPTTNFFQAATEAFPQSNVPLTHQEIGLTAKDDIQQFGELEKKLPDMDLRSQYQADPEGFGLILQWLKAGKAPNGTKFTIKEAIAAITGNQ